MGIFTGKKICLKRGKVENKRIRVWQGEVTLSLLQRQKKMRGKKISQGWEQISFEKS